MGLTGADGLHSELVRKRQILLHALHLLRALQSDDLPPWKPMVLSVGALLAAGESSEVEFKSTLRTNLHTGQRDEKVQLAVLKTIAGFLNAQGGTLMVGVGDDGKVLGLSADAFENEDKMGLHLVNLIRDRIGEIFLPYGSYVPGAKVKLDEICKILGLTGKPDGVDGSRVEEMVLDGQIEEVARYCESDVLNTYRVRLHTFKISLQICEGGSLADPLPMTPLRANLNVHP